MESILALKELEIHPGQATGPSRGYFRKTNNYQCPQLCPASIGSTFKLQNIFYLPYYILCAV